MEPEKHDDRDLRTKAKEAARAIKELGVSVGKTMDYYLSKEAPRAAAIVDKGLDKAAKGFESALTSLDKKTSRQQFELLSSYKNFLQQQIELVDRKLNSLKNQRTPSSSASSFS